MSEERISIKVTISCGLCDERLQRELFMAEDWDHRLRGIDDELSGFCPKHAPVKAFTDAQCPGCTGGWGDCRLFQAFAYGRLELGDDEFDALERGYCPRRLEGMMRFSVSPDLAVEPLPVCEPAASPQSGKALAQAIKDYVELFNREPAY